MERKKKMLLDGSVWWECKVKTQRLKLSRYLEPSQSVVLCPSFVWDVCTLVWRRRKQFREAFISHSPKRKTKKRKEQQQKKITPLTLTTRPCDQSQHLAAAFNISPSRWKWFRHVRAARLPANGLPLKLWQKNRKQRLPRKVSGGSKGEIQEVTVSVATANEISLDAVTLDGIFTIRGY